MLSEPRRLTIFILTYIVSVAAQSLLPPYLNEAATSSSIKVSLSNLLLTNIDGQSILEYLNIDNDAILHLNFLITTSSAIRVAKFTFEDGSDSVQIDKTLHNVSIDLPDQVVLFNNTISSFYVVALHVEFRYFNTSRILVGKDDYVILVDKTSGNFYNNASSDAAIKKEFSNFPMLLATAHFRVSCDGNNNYGFYCNQLCNVPEDPSLYCFDCREIATGCCNDDNYDQSTCMKKSTAATTRPPAEDKSSTNEKLFMWIMIGLAILLLIVFLFLIIVSVCYCQYRKKIESRSFQTPPPPPPPPIQRRRGLPPSYASRFPQNHLDISEGRINSASPDVSLATDEYTEPIHVREARV